MTGTITWYNEKSGFGFVVSANGGNPLYFQTPERERFSVGQKVTYQEEIDPSVNRKVAVEVNPEA